MLIRDTKRYYALRAHYQQQHPRITLSAIDAFVDRLIAGEFNPKL